MKPATDAVRSPAVKIVDLSKHYGPVVALDKVSLSIEAGEYFVLLGPSGGGKTTLLRTIGGFHRPTSGQVFLHGKEVTGLPPDKRPTSMVFQSYALFPHMNVEKNVGYGLSLAGRSKNDIRDKTHAMLDMVGLSGYAERKPHELSGGQQQRVQLARSLVLDRDILLLDEPLAALDAQLRKDMCLELKHLQEKVGITFVHVTHNQEEAMTVADRIALVADGHLIEHGNAQQIYESPIHRFTASFVGENNLFDGTVAAVDGESVIVDTANGQLHVLKRNLNPQVGQSVTVSLRSELIRLTNVANATSATDGAGQFHAGCMLPAIWRESVYLGLTTSHRLNLPDGQEAVCRMISDGTHFVAPAPGETVCLHWQAEDARLHVR
ncbi:MAG: ABC transporter ATP-binding protein [Burkholderiaceae bacterium]